MQTQPIVSHPKNVGAIERGISLLSGLALLTYVLRRRPRLRLPLSFDAGYMIYRGATGHCIIYQKLGINRTGRKEGFNVQRLEAQNAGYSRKVEKALSDREREREIEEQDVVELTSEDSFPASDPPGWVSSKRKKASNGGT